MVDFSRPVSRKFLFLGLLSLDRRIDCVRSLFRERLLLFDMSSSPSLMVFTPVSSFAIDLQRHLPAIRFFPNYPPHLFNVSSWISSSSRLACDPHSLRRLTSPLCFLFFLLASCSLPLFSPTPAASREQHEVWLFFELRGCFLLAENFVLSPLG